jgi:hypothetical protein
VLIPMNQLALIAVKHPGALKTKKLLPYYRGKKKDKQGQEKGPAQGAGRREFKRKIDFYPGKGGGPLDNSGNGPI